MEKKDPLTAPYPILGADGRLLWQGEYVKRWGLPNLGDSITRRGHSCGKPKQKSRETINPWASIFLLKSPIK
jgi:hypothetical protein